MTGVDGRVRAGFWRDLDRRIHFEWLVVTIALSTLTVLMSYFSHGIGLTRLDHTFYDNMLATASRHPADNDIVIVAIDDASIERIGSWPWRRRLHAALPDQLREIGRASCRERVWQYV